MSYILDALNKADKDRQQQAPNSTTSASPQHEPTTTRQTNTGKYSLFIVFITLMLLILWVFVSSDQTSIQQQDTMPQKIQTVTFPTPKVQIVVPVKKVTSQPIQVAATKTEPVQEKTKVTPSIMALDSTLQNQLPPIAISAHVYSEEASKRMVIINNQVKHEQQYIGEQLQLTHITPHGIELRYKEVLFTMTVKDQWPRF